MFMRCFILLFCLFTAGLNAYSDTLEDFALTGNVVEVEELSWEADISFKEGEYEFLSGRKLFFDKNGNLLTELWCKEKGEYTTVIQFVYDQSDNLVEKSFSRSRDILPDITVFRRNEEGKLEELVHSFTAGTYGWIYRYRYNEHGLIEEKKKYELSGDEVAAIRYRYDDAGRLVEELLLDTRGRTLSLKGYTYGDGWVIRELAPDGRAVVSRKKTEYNERGHPVLEYTVLESGKRLNTRTFRYTYDHYGNWTERTEEYIGENFRMIVTQRILRYDNRSGDIQQEARE